MIIKITMLFHKIEHHKYHIDNNNNQVKLTRNSRNTIFIENKFQKLLEIDFIHFEYNTKYRFKTKLNIQEYINNPQFKLHQAVKY